MKLGRRRKSEDLKINMTAMIDIVFQLLIFFILTFKVAALEGDFEVKMPLASTNPSSMDEVLPTVIHVGLTAGVNRDIASIEIDDGTQALTFTQSDMFQQLTGFVESVVAREGDPSMASEVEVEFDIADELRYRFTVKAIEAVSGRVLPDGTVKKLVNKIKFTQPQE
ncbi:MAG: biopolymer transporter ExbD [Planctomycetota bacterium]